MPWAVSEGARALMLLCVCVCDTNACVMNPTIAASPLCLTLSIKREHTHTHKATQAPINLGSGTSFAHFPNNPLSLTLSLTLLSRFLRTCLCHVHAQRLTHAQILCCATKRAPVRNTAPNTSNTATHKTSHHVICA